MPLTILAYESAMKQSENRLLELRMIRHMKGYKNIRSHHENLQICFYFKIHILDSEQTLG